MKLQEVLSEYQYNNVGQFNAIANSLGYQQKYNNGLLHFSSDDDEFSVSMDKIRSQTKNEPDPAMENASMDRICKFFDKEQALSPEYKEFLSKEGVDIVNWGDLRNDAKDRFTVIDHKNKICYTGKKLYEYASQNGYILDGKGTQLEKGVHSELLNIGGKPAKVRLTEGGVSILYRKEALVIPDYISGKKLSKQQQQDLLNGNVIVLSSKKGDILLQVDRELNSVVLRSEKELSIPVQIGGYELTPADKYLLANNHSLDNKLLHTPDGYIIANVSMNPDKKGFSFSNVQVIPETKAKEMLEKKSEVHSRNLEAEFKEAVSKNDYEKLAHLKEDGYKPSEEVIKGLGQDSNVDEKQAIVIEKLFGIKPEIQTVASVINQVEQTNNQLSIPDIVKRGKTENDLGVQFNRLYNQASGDPQRQERISQAFHNVRNNLRSYGFGTELGDSNRVSSIEQRQMPLENSPIKQQDEVVTHLEQERLPENYIIKLDAPVVVGDYINSLQQSGIDVSVLNTAFPPDIAKSEKVDTLYVMVENGKITDWEPVINESDYAVPIKLFSDFEIGVPEKVSSGIDFKNALESNDFEKISQLKDQGYQLSDKDKQLLAGMPENTSIAVQKIFGLKSHANTFGDVKLAQSGKREKDITRPLTSTINRAFNDL